MAHTENSLPGAREGRRETCGVDPAPAMVDDDRIEANWMRHGDCLNTGLDPGLVWRQVDTRKPRVFLVTLIFVLVFVFGQDFWLIAFF